MSLSPTIIEAFQSSVSWQAMTVAVGGIIAGGIGFTVAALPAFSKYLLPSPKETRLADHLPFDRVLPGGRTIVCRDGTLVRCLRIEGRDIGFLPPQERERLFLMRKQWIDTLAEAGVQMRVFVVRNRAHIELSDDYDQPVLRLVAQRWNQGFYNSFHNQQYIVLSLKGGSASAIQKLDDVTDITKTILSEYRPYVLNQHEDNPKNRLLTFWARVTSPITRPNPLGTGENVSDAITADTVEFDRATLIEMPQLRLKKATDFEIQTARTKHSTSGIIRFSSGTKEVFCSCVGLRGLSEYTSESFVADIAAMPSEVIITHVIEPYSRLKAAAALDIQGRASLAQRLSLGTAQQFEEAKDMVEGSDERASALAQYTMMVYCYGDSIEELVEIEAEIKKIASWHGYTPVRESAIAQASWFSQFPSYPMWPRSYKLFSKNVVSHVILDKQPEGLKNSDWGAGPIAMFRTAVGTPYSFQFHVSEEPAAVAHAVAIAPTGAGKTTLVTFLAGMAMRHKDLRVFMIDRHGGAYIFTKAVGGNYVTFDESEYKGTKSFLNPFQMDGTPQNKSFLRGLLQALADIDNDDSDSLEEIAFAVNAAYDTPGLPKEQRSLRNIYDATFSKSKRVRKQLLRWVDPTQFGDILNAPQDNLDLTSSRLVTFDFTRLYEHEDLARAVILYLMHRIQETITRLNVPALIFIDETEPVVQHPLFRKFYLQMLQEFRKRRASVISAFQRPEAISNAGLGQVLRGQAQTTFFMPNPQAQEEEYADWDLTDTEMIYIKGRGLGQRLHRSVLVKRGHGESVILDTDLSILGPLLRIFRSDDQSKKIANNMMEEYKEDWLHYYVNHRTD